MGSRIKVLLSVVVLLVGAAILFAPTPASAACPGGVCTVAPGSSTATINGIINTTAACGDQVQFVHGNTYIINTTLSLSRDCGSQPALIITTDDLASLPVAGRRVNNTTDPTHMAKIQNQSGGLTMFRMTGKNIIIIGLELTNTSNQQMGGGLIQIEGADNGLDRTFQHPGVYPNNVAPYNTDMGGLWVQMIGTGPYVINSYIDGMWGIPLGQGPGATMAQSTGTFFISTTCDIYTGTTPPTPTDTRSCTIDNNYITGSYAMIFTGGFDWAAFPTGYGSAEILTASTQTLLKLDSVGALTTGMAMSVEMPDDVAGGNWAGATNWNSGTTYSAGAKVIGSDTYYYYAISGSTGVNPVGNNNVVWQHGWCQNGFLTHGCWVQGRAGTIDTLNKTVTVNMPTGAFDGGLWAWAPGTNSNLAMQWMGDRISNINPKVGGRVQWMGYQTRNVIWTRNHNHFDTAFQVWQQANNGNSPKGFGEFKDGVNITIDGNYQDGYPSAWFQNPNTQYGSSAWTNVSHFTVSNNAQMQTRTACFAIEQEGYAMTGISDYITCDNNLFVGFDIVNDSDTTFGHMGNIDHWQITHNTYPANYSASTGSQYFLNTFFYNKYLGSATTAHMIMTDNIMGNGNYGIQLYGCASVAACWPGATMNHNAFVQFPGCTNNFNLNSVMGGVSPTVCDMANVGFTNPAAGDWSLSPASPFYTKSTTGGPLGADICQIDVHMGPDNPQLLGCGSPSGSPSTFGGGHVGTGIILRTALDQLIFGISGEVKSKKEEIRNQYAKAMGNRGWEGRTVHSMGYKSATLDQYARYTY